MTMETIVTMMTIDNDDRTTTVMHFHPRPTHGLILTIVVAIGIIIIIIMAILTFALDA